ncbi:MAG: hypothetical protein AAF487_08905 [Bacteroidota bacterium]
MSRDNLDASIPKNVSQEDSIKLAHLFVDNWVRKQVVLNQADLNLSDLEKNVELELEKYKEDLIIYRFERELLRQKLDTAISNEQTETYYMENIDMFKLNDYAIQVVYASFPIDHEDKKELKNLIKNYSREDSLQLQNICEDPEMKCYNKEDEWIYLKNVLREIPLTIYNEESFLKKNKFVSFDEKGIQYLLFVKDFKLKDAYSPIDLETNNIKSLILNARKLKLLEDMRDELFLKALNNGEIEVKK